MKGGLDSPRLADPLNLQTRVAFLSGEMSNLCIWQIAIERGTETQKVNALTQAMHHESLGGGDMGATWNHQHQEACDQDTHTLLSTVSTQKSNLAPQGCWVIKNPITPASPIATVAGGTGLCNRFGSAISLSRLSVTWVTWYAWLLIHLQLALMTLMYIAEQFPRHIGMYLYGVQSKSPS